MNLYPHFTAILLMSVCAGCATVSPSVEMHDRPLQEVRSLAEAGDREAIHDLCYRYKYGLSAPQDFAEAHEWCLLAAAKGADSSQVLLAEMFHGGQGVAQDFTVALTWYQAAAVQGHPHALLMLYHMYSRGQGVEADREQALVFLRLAAEDGYQLAIDELKKLESVSTQ